MFGRKSRAERLREEAQNRSLISGARLAAAYGGARPIAERLLYDDDLRDNIRTFIDSARKILDELSGEDPSEIVTKLWDDKKLRKEVEAAVEAAEEGTKRLQGRRVRGGGSFGKLLLVLVLVAAGGFLFFNQRTGPEARRIAKDVFSNLTSGG